MQGKFALNRYLSKSATRIPAVHVLTFSSSLGGMIGHDKHLGILKDAVSPFCCLAFVGSCADITVS